MSKNIDIDFTVTIKEEHNWDSSGRATTSVVIRPDFLEHIDVGNILLGLVGAAYEDHLEKKDKKESEENEDES